jgi:hypothetical protein
MIIVNGEYFKDDGKPHELNNNFPDRNQILSKQQGILNKQFEDTKRR